MKRRYRVRKPIREIIEKMTITILIGIVDIIIYHYLAILGVYAGVNTWASTFIYVGWFWLIGGQFIWLFAIWE